MSNSVNGSTGSFGLKTSEGRDACVGAANDRVADRRFELLLRM